MTQSKLKNTLKTGLTLFGGVVLAALVVRSQKRAKETGETFSQAAQNEFKNVVQTS